MDAKVSEHGVRLPAAEELDRVLVHTGAVEGGGAAGAQGPSRYVGRVDAGDSLEEAGGVSEGVGDVGLQAWC